MAWPFGSKHRSASEIAARPRRVERFPAVGLSCHLGEVVDLSASGMRVQHTGKPVVERGALVQLGIRNQTQKVQVSARVAWAKRTGWKSYEVGFQFVDVKPAVAAVLVTLARYGFVASDRSIGTGESQGNERPDPRSTVRVAVEVEDLYGALGIPSDASQDEVQSAYRKLARTHHPDVSEEPDAEVRFAFISKAYSVLRDPAKRKRYDTLLALSRAGGQQRAA